MELKEWRVLRQEVERVARKSEDILGVLAVRSACHDTTELWLDVRDTELSAKGSRVVELGGAALREEIDGGTIKLGTAQWHNKKRMVFGDYYHNPLLYPEGFDKEKGNDEPWEAYTFKDELFAQLSRILPSFRHEMLTINAQPESLFHLRVNPEGVNETVDRMPFPIVMDQEWMTGEFEKTVLFASPEADIFPFSAGGRVLGSLMAEHIAEVKNNTHKVNYGGILLKPDAIEGNQVTSILTKVNEHVARFGGRIILQESFSSLTADDVQTIYPLLRGKELGYAVSYLTSGPVVGVIIEMPGSITEVLKKINSIKGPRIGDRSEDRLVQGRIEDGGIRDLLPLPGDEEMYRSLLEDLRLRRQNPAHEFTEEQYCYLARNLAHTPDNTVELSGLFSFMQFSRPSESL